MKGLLESIENNQGEEASTKVMRACGYQCIDDGIINSAKRIYDQNVDMDVFIEELNQQGIGGGNSIRDGNKLRASYNQCYCNISEKKTLPR